MIFRRKLYFKVKKAMDSQEVIVITGMRRVGKTTLCRIIFDEIESDNKVFLDIENPIDQKIFEEEDYNNVMINLRQRYGIDPLKRAYIFIDEMQAMPQISRIVKYIYDHYDAKFVITGSSSFYLKNLFPESLAGRKFVFELYPLDFDEFLEFRRQSRPKYETFLEREANKKKIIFEKLEPFFEEYLEFGGFPGVVTVSDIEDKKMRLNDIFKSYFEKDVQGLAEFREITAFRDLLLLLMQRVGSKLELGKLQSEIGISNETANKYLSFLESTYFIHLLTPYTKNVDREVSGTKKVYFCDTGILNQFAKVSPGSLFENAVYLATRVFGKTHYYQKRKGGEIDFILPDANLAIEVKSKGTPQDYKSLVRTAKTIGLTDCYLVTREYNDQVGTIPAVYL